MGSYHCLYRARVGEMPPVDERRLRRGDHFTVVKALVAVIDLIFLFCMNDSLIGAAGGCGRRTVRVTYVGG